MDAIKEYLNDEKYQPDLYDDDGWRLLDRAKMELESSESAEARVRELEAANAELKRQVEQAQEHIRRLEAERVEMLVNSIRGEK